LVIPVSDLALYLSKQTKRGTKRGKTKRMKRKDPGQNAPRYPGFNVG
jgi:hypothetical protein